MGASTSSSNEEVVQRPMRCRTESQVPKCFREVKCPYPQAQTAMGQYGAINYSLQGPEDAEVVVCFHGLNGSRLLFQETGEFLAKQDFRVLSFDLYGHGMSNAPRVDLCPSKGCRGCASSSVCGGPRGRYDLDFFVNQTDDLLHVLGIGDRPVNLVGFSLGGTIAVAFAQRYPSRVLRLVAMSPAGFLPKVPPSYYLLKAVWCCLIPLAPHVLCTCWYKKERFRKSMQGEGQVDEEMVENLWGRFVWQLYVKRGVASATLAVCHRVPWFNLQPLFKDAGRHPRPVMLVWGEKDTLNPPNTVAQEVKGCFSNVRLMVVPGAGHISICDKPRQVILSIHSFLRLPADTRMETAAISLPPALRPSAGRQAAGPSPVAAAPCAIGKVAEEEEANKPMHMDGEELEWQLLKTGGNRQLAAASQMPVPMVLGHTEDADREPFIASEAQALSQL